MRKGTMEKSYELCVLMVTHIEGYVAFQLHNDDDDLLELLNPLLFE